MMSCRLIGVVVLLCATACASRSAAPVTQREVRRCDVRSQLESAAILQLDNAQPETLRFDGGVSCSGDRAVARLPRLRKDWVLTLNSKLTGKSLFAPEVFTLDAHGQVLRSLPFERFTQRGDHLEATLFFSKASAAERYVLVQSSLEVVGRQTTQVVSSSFAVPILTALMPFVYMQGIEHERSYTLSHNGIVQLQARAAVPVGRVPQAHNVARAELGAMAR